MTSDPDDLAAARTPLARDRFRVAMGDTDAAQVIYFGAPARWAERLVTTWLADVKFPTSEMLAAGFGMPAVHAELTYRSPLRLDDPVEGTLWLHHKSAVRDLAGRVHPSRRITTGGRGAPHPGARTY